jgi:photosystem II stability/assembly factor-like uncharacterized protein
MEHYELGGNFFGVRRRKDVKFNIMIHYATILTLLLATTALGQTKDRRAELDIQGRVNEISVSPDEKIWLVTAVGETYFTDNIDSNWHYGKPLFETKDDYSFDGPNLERISFFNEDTAIMTGYISVSKNEGTKNGYYLTKDAGKSWKLLDYGGDSWIYTIHTDKNGNAWMGGLKKELYYSKDFGQSWITIKLPYKSSDRTYGINMSNSNSGVASSDDNEIITTEDNWKTVAHLKTPLDQKKYKPDESRGYVDSRISKILKWDKYIVVNQKGHIFYSEASNINWKSFPITIIDFELDAGSKKLFAVTDSLKVLSFSTPTDFQTLSDERFSGFPIDIKAVNNSLFVVCNGYEIYKANEGGLTHSIPYTTDKKISEPSIVKQFSKLTWGINGNQIYLSEDKQDWYRENALEFGVADFMLLSDSVAILWDGVKNNYRYSLNDHIPKIYFPADPIKSFLASPIKSFSINSGSQGCFHSVTNEINYERTKNSTFTTSKLSVNRNEDKEKSTFKNIVSSQILENALAAINSNPSAVPSLLDFQITEKDKKNYLDLVDEQFKSKEIGKKKLNKEFYYSIPAILDTLNSSIITDILNQQEGVWSTTSNWFKIQMVNQKNDTLNISRSYYVSTLPWNLPWKFEYKGQNFNCYNVEFSKFINACIPDNFMDKEVFDNKILIMQIANNLHDKLFRQN